MQLWMTYQCETVFSLQPVYFCPKSSDRETHLSHTKAALGKTGLFPDGPPRLCQLELRSHMVSKLNLTHRIRTEPGTQPPPLLLLPLPPSHRSFHGTRALIQSKLFKRMSSRAGSVSWRSGSDWHGGGGPVSHHPSLFPSLR